ncbi:hypothetical protein Rhopal_002233-T1 [Rhodotorula paludigena]|uniref:rRNA adenine N(6)-methyltransferase n=1 Tax=Rhodotorula paludigena TaxID=86838 RepID=A0AAV5GJ72_9BASI|nr:hypothetical protein Rhopal_002233-T1 [Rhodotorula paludigena]
MHSLRATTSRLAACAAPPPLRSFSTARPALIRVVRNARPTPLDTTLKKLKHPRRLPDGVPKTELFTGLTETPAVRGRSTLVNEESARALVKAWGIDRMQDVTVVEAYAGPGGITRALLELPNVKRVAAVEDAYRYYPFLEVLASQVLKERYPGRVEHIGVDSFRWEAYTEVEQRGLFDDVPTLSFDQGAQIPSTVYGQQLFVQLVSAIAGEMWYFQKGRMQMGFLGSETLWKKILAKPGDPEFHKLAVLINSLAIVERCDTLLGFAPPTMHFHRPRGDMASYSAIKVTPREKPLVKNYDALEYVTRHMFVGKATPWEKAFTSIAPGAGNLLPNIREQGLDDPKKTVSQLTMKDWIILADTFNEWPFRPQTLFDDFGFSEERI